MRIQILASLLGVTLTACLAGPTPSDPFAARLDARAPSFAMDSSWLRLGGAPPAPEAGLQAYADWLANHPRVRALPVDLRAALLQNAPLVAARRSLHTTPRAVVDPLSLVAATNPTWTIATTTPIDTTAAVLVAGASPDNTNDRLVFEGADSPAHYIGIATNLYTASPTVVKSASIGSRIDGSAILTNIPGTVAYAVTSAGVVYAINVADATTAWSASVGSGVSRSTPWLDFTTGYLYVADLGGKVTAINTTDGSVVWSVDVTGGIAIHSSPLVMNGLVWVGADDGQLYRADAATGAVVGAATKLCLGATCTPDDAIYSAISGDLLTAGQERVLLGVNRRIIEIDASTATGCTAATTTTCGFTAYPIQEGSAFTAPAGRFESAVGIDFTNGRVYFGYANRLWRASYNAGITSAFARAGGTGDPTGLLRGANPTSHGYPRGIPFAFNNAVFVGDGAGLFHRFDTGTWTESAWKSFNGGTAPGKSGPSIDSTALIDFTTGGNVYFGVARPTNGEWDSLPQSFTSDTPTPGAATHFRVTTTGFATAGVPFSVTVTALDANGNRATGFTGTIRLSSSDSTATGIGTLIMVAGWQGQANYNSVTLNTAGSQVLTAVALANPDINGATGVCVGAGPCGPIVATERATYNVGERIVTAFAFLPGNTNDYVALSPAGSAASSTTTFQYTGGALEGTLSFSGVQGGSYEARAYLNGSFTILDASPTFVVSGTRTITTDASTYTTTTPIVVNWTGAAGQNGDWVAIAPDGSSSSTYTAFASTGGAVNGMTTFAAGTIPAGTYRARLFFNNTGFTIQAESASFTVTASATVTISTNAPTYVQGAPIQVTWANALGSSTDWIAIAPDGSAPTTLVQWVYTGGATSGTRTFAGIAPGTYRARIFFNDNYIVQAESAAFTVTANTATTVTTNATAYAVGAPIVVTWSGMLGNTTDWVSIAPAGSPASTYLTWVYTGGQINGSNTFNVSLAPGTYVARAYFNNNFVLQDESPPFTVGP